MCDRNATSLNAFRTRARRRIETAANVLECAAFALIQFAAAAAHEALIIVVTLEKRIVDLLLRPVAFHSQASLALQSHFVEQLSRRLRRRCHFLLCNVAEKVARRLNWVGCRPVSRYLVDEAAFVVDPT